MIRKLSLKFRVFFPITFSGILSYVVISMLCYIIHCFITIDIFTAFANKFFILFNLYVHVFENLLFIHVA